MEIRVQIDGIDDALRTLDSTVRHDAIRDGLMAAALYVEGQAKLKAAIDTGFLRNAIWSAVQGRSNYNERSAEAHQRNPLAEMLPEDTRGSLEAIVVAGADYAIYQEMGTRFMPSHPFMRPALEGSRAQITQIVSEAIARRARR